MVIGFLYGTSHVDNDITPLDSPEGEEGKIEIFAVDAVTSLLRNFWPTMES